MKFMRIYVVSDQATIVLSVIAILIMLAAIFFLARSYFKERQRIQEEKAFLIEGVLTKAEITSIITSHIARMGKDGQFSLIYLDLDKFSDFVNAFGATESEKVLEKIVKNIEISLPKGVKLSRLQNDEFLIFLSMDYDRTEAVDLANKIKQSLARPIKLFGDTTINATASIAVAFYPIHGAALKDLLNSLKLATYLIKKNGGNNIRVYSDEMNTEGGEHVEYYYQIKHAIQHKEFQLFYHPMINVKTNDIYGVESLIRWNHPEHGLLSPFKFLGIMEQSGDINWIGLWGLETVIKTYQELKQEFPKKEFKFSINLSPKQLMNESLSQDFQKLLKKYRMNAENIVLEVIEFAVFDKPMQIHKTLSDLKKMGFQIAIDGFGLDFSTLSRAEALDIDIIKLDNEFLKEEESYMKAKFAQLLVDFAEKNSYTVICEAIENKDMLEEAKKYSINIMQGFYFTKPLSAEALRGYIGTESWKDVEK
ncbi:MAG: bifunctional diguanylate cyclase/phosphodiesterase [Acholeplasmataceae bacterium]|jgi:diguanylate cyclase (GGDEF)-like protein|nr:bifunctional diguanylate cyclase/phosphodiesterase [Acholeplasmataceae bacterium]